MWYILGRRVRDSELTSPTVNELHIVFQEEWQNIPQDNIRNLVDGMNRRMQAVGLNFFQKKVHSFKIRYS